MAGADSREAVAISSKLGPIVDDPYGPSEFAGATRGGRKGMNIQASSGLPRRPMPAARAPSRLKAVMTARRHSKHVRILKLLLPVCAVAVLGLYFVSSKISISLGDMQASVGDIDINSESLRMTNPKLEGVTDDGGAYQLTADYAEQDIGNMEQMRLHAVRAELTQPKDTWSKMTAPKGKFDSKKESLELFGGINISTSTGMVAKLDRANIDLKTQLIRSDVPVEVEAREGTLTAKTLQIKAAEKRILFKGDVRVHIIRGEADKEGGQQAATAAEAQ